MKLALECTTELLRAVQPLADFDWVLAHKCKEDAKYLEFYKDNDREKFIDNSVNELGEPLGIEELKEVRESLGGGFIVSPDWVGQGAQTLGAYVECVKAFGKEHVVGVLQGSTFEEVFDILPQYGGGVMCIPYDICSSKGDPPEIMALRRALVVSRIPADKFYVHLLGFNTLEEFIWYRGVPYVGSMDTGAPVLLGLKGINIEDGLVDKQEPTFNLMEGLEFNQKAWTGICLNVALLRKYIS